MLATTIDSPKDINLRDPALLYEPKLDGIRGLILIEPAQPSPRITIWSRNGNDKTHQFPEVVRGLKEFGKRLRVPVILDGEIVALTELGEPAGSPSSVNATISPSSMTGCRRRLPNSFNPRTTSGN